jgi:hypothetical protein
MIKTRDLRILATLGVANGSLGIVSLTEKVNDRFGTEYQSMVIGIDIRRLIPGGQVQLDKAGRVLITDLGRSADTSSLKEKKTAQPPSERRLAVA